MKTVTVVNKSRTMRVAKGRDSQRFVVIQPNTFAVVPVEDWTVAKHAFAEQIAAGDFEVRTEPPVESESKQSVVTAERKTALPGADVPDLGMVGWREAVKTIEEWTDAAQLKLMRDLENERDPEPRTSVLRAIESRIAELEG